MIRTSYGNFFGDEKYKQNIEGMEKIGVPYGLYHFSYEINIDEVKEEAEKFINLIKNYKPLYPIVVDIKLSNIANVLTSN